MKSRVTGLSPAPSIFLIRPFSTVTSSEQESGQSSGHAVRTVEWPHVSGADGRGILHYRMPAAESQIPKGISHSAFDIRPPPTAAHVDAGRAAAVLHGTGRVRQEFVGAFVHAAVPACFVRARCDGRAAGLAVDNRGIRVGDAEHFARPGGWTFPATSHGSLLLSMASKRHAVRYGRGWDTLPGHGGCMADLTGRMIGAMKADVKTLSEIEADPNAFTQAITVIVIAGVAALIGNIFRAGILAGVIQLIARLIGYFLFTFLVFLMGTKVMPEPSTKADFNETFRTVDGSGITFVPIRN